MDKYIATCGRFIMEQLMEICIYIYILCNLTDICLAT